ncbi:DNA-binding response regulator, OmpR family, contains REC and winged-helix (wHTH) domain [Marininema mesophilum]|uniref:DNA-binding response regulator, OmpR family, contains REC and winged-helix (WHTH) domain n=1 Tax=Marininema mesophilum TaxID=1048340 RepID=A0A1H2WPD5_9BACL|nr:response regulator transcription factor [Marininema mesophilum]SDW82124.1 DNA-binding response regulator, OmpR family, contains REC and winged-helix (wHTH) domain [Marininema mesophilum]
MEKKVLIIEDEANLARFLELEFIHEGWTVETAFEGRVGLQRSLEDRWDIIVLDVMLPDLSGVEVCRRIRGESSVPVMLLTARDAIPDRVSGLDAGADDYMTKPFAIEELFARVRALLRRKEPREGKVLINGPCRLLLEQRRALCYEKDVRLTAREFDLLVFLMKNRDRVMGREQILDQVWGFDYAGDTNLVDVYIRYLRNKLSQEGVTDLIETVRGVGYVIRGLEDAD